MIIKRPTSGERLATTGEILRRQDRETRKSFQMVREELELLLERIRNISKPTPEELLESVFETIKLRISHYAV